jgi:hypothetical protein
MYEPYIHATVSADTYVNIHTHVYMQCVSTLKSHSAVLAPADTYEYIHAHARLRILSK